MTEPRRVRPVTNVNGFTFTTDGEPYDEAWQIGVQRERARTFAEEPLQLEARLIGVHLADALRRDIPDVDPVLAGRALLAAMASGSSLAAAGYPATFLANVLAYAADDLVGDAL